MEINGKRQEEVFVVSVTGRMDGVSAPEFEKELGDLIGQGGTTFIVDFGGLDYISSAGLRSILIIAKKLRAINGKIMLSALKDVVKEVFEISGFTSIIPVYESEEAARKEI